MFKCNNLARGRRKVTRPIILFFNGARDLLLEVSALGFHRLFNAIPVFSIYAALTNLLIFL